MEFSDIHIHPSMEEQEKQLKLLFENVNKETIQALLKKNGYSLSSYSYLSNSKGVINPIFVIITESGARLILRVVNPHKFWKRIKTISDVNTIQMVQRETSIPVPKIVDYSYDSTTSILKSEYVLMEELKGENLGDYIEKMSHEERLAIYKQIILYIRELQDVKLGEAGKYIGALSKEIGNYKELGPITHDGPSLGPFSTFDEILKQIVMHTLFLLKSDPKLMERFGKFIDPLLNLVKTKTVSPIPSKNVICHLDLHPGNILFDPKTMKITGILDWEHSRIAPWEQEYFTFIGFTRSYGLKVEDVEELLKMIQPEKPNENIRELNTLIECIKGLSFFSATWYQAFDSFDLRLKYSIEEGLRCGEELTCLLKMC